MPGTAVVPCRRFCRYQARCDAMRLLPRPARADMMAVSGALGMPEADGGTRLIDRTSGAGHARYGQRDGLGGGPHGGNNGSDGERGKQFFHDELL